MYVNKIVESVANIKNVYLGRGIFSNLMCENNHSAEETDLKNFEHKIGILPEDYRRFLEITNGMRFFESGDFILFSLQEVIELKETMDFKDEIYPIGYFLEDYIVIKSDEIYTGSYIYAGDAYCCDEYFSLNCNFETFLDRYIMANANNYWRWQSPKEKFNFMK